MRSIIDSPSTLAKSSSSKFVELLHWQAAAIWDKVLDSPAVKVVKLDKVNLNMNRLRQQLSLVTCRQEGRLYVYVSNELIDTDWLGLLYQQVDRREVSTSNSWAHSCHEGAVGSGHPGQRFQGGRYRISRGLGKRDQTEVPQLTDL